MGVKFVGDDLPMEEADTKLLQGFLREQKVCKATRCRGQSIPARTAPNGIQYPEFVLYSIEVPGSLREHAYKCKLYCSSCGSVPTTVGTSSQGDWCGCDQPFQDDKTTATANGRSLQCQVVL